MTPCGVAFLDGRTWKAPIDVSIRTCQVTRKGKETIIPLDREEGRFHCRELAAHVQADPAFKSQVEGCNSLIGRSPLLIDLARSRARTLIITYLKVLRLVTECLLQIPGRSMPNAFA